ncbi:hypothetical protein KXD93_04085 [Mucilaginibacter sp. BJC16-A38]|uniref:hypothetical protein n=1 Tax=Mucilaginibacter phenanthrenivorans TaxID=1234842 RepID=UPI0021575D2D|nr:hypothetical protein [Mucilaginibacter phenanthrenivorans]MCR8556802.1 hypothetical protein [Mucilaginibacter phenanthrenivorans]MDP9078733.1 hypothetical protein [Bacteroidota bacterium]
MKKIFLTIATAALISVNVFAADGGKKGETATASYAVQQAFSADFSNATNAVWTITKNTQKVDFLIDGVKKTAFYTLAGEFLGTTQYVSYDAIPARSQKLIASSYKDYTAGDVIVYQTNEALNRDIESTTYFVDLKNAEHEVLVRVTNSGAIEFFKQVK